MQMSQVLQPFARLGQSPVGILSQLVMGRTPSSAAGTPRSGAAIDRPTWRFLK